MCFLQYKDISITFYSRSFRDLKFWICRDASLVTTSFFPAQYITLTHIKIFRKSLNVGVMIRGAIGVFTWHLSFWWHLQATFYMKLPVRVVFSSISLRTIFVVNSNEIITDNKRNIINTKWWKRKRNITMQTKQILKSSYSLYWRWHCRTLQLYGA